MVTMQIISIIFKLQLLGIFQCPKFRVHPAPEVHDFAIRCMNFSSNFEHLIYHIKHSADILARRMFLRGPAPYACIKEFLKFRHRFYGNCYPTTNYKNNRCKTCAFPVKIMIFGFNVQNHALHYPNPINAITPNRLNIIDGPSEYIYNDKRLTIICQKKV